MAKINRICSVQDCGKDSYKRGLCCPHYERLRRHGDPLAGRVHDGDVARFINEIAMQFKSNECLTWPFATDNYGYGKLRFDGRTISAHRYICTLVHGLHKEDRTQAAHSCGMGSKGCVNPNHLSWKTRKENEADKLLHGTHARGERCGTSKLTEADVKEIRILKGVKPQKEIAERFQISVPTVSEIQNRRKWSWLPD